MIYGRRACWSIYYIFIPYTFLSSLCALSPLYPFLSPLTSFSVTDSLLFNNHDLGNYLSLSLVALRWALMGSPFFVRCQFSPRTRMQYHLYLVHTIGVFFTPLYPSHLINSISSLRKSCDKSIKFFSTHPFIQMYNFTSTLLIWWPLAGSNILFSISCLYYLEKSRFLPFKAYLY